MLLAQAGGTDWGPSMVTTAGAVVVVVVGWVLSYWGTLRLWRSQRRHDFELFKLREARTLFVEALTRVSDADSAIRTFANVVSFEAEEFEGAQDLLEKLSPRLTYLSEVPSVREADQDARAARTDVRRIAVEVRTVLPGDFSSRLTQVVRSMEVAYYGIWVCALSPIPSTETGPRVKEVLGRMDDSSAMRRELEQIATKALLSPETL